MTTTHSIYFLYCVASTDKSHPKLFLHQVVFIFGRPIRCRVTLLFASYALNLAKKRLWDHYSGQVFILLRTGLYVQQIDVYGAIFISDKPFRYCSWPALPPRAPQNVNTSRFICVESSSAISVSAPTLSQSHRCFSNCLRHSLWYCTLS